MWELDVLKSATWLPVVLALVTVAAAGYLFQTGWAKRHVTEKRTREDSQSGSEGRLAEGSGAAAVESSISQAATVIAKHFRGFLVRKQFAAIKQVSEADDRLRAEAAAAALVAAEEARRQRIAEAQARATAAHFARQRAEEESKRLSHLPRKFAVALGQAALTGTGGVVALPFAIAGAIVGAANGVRGGPSGFGHGLKLGASAGAGAAFYSVSLLAYPFVKAPHHKPPPDPHPTPPPPPPPSQENAAPSNNYTLVQGTRESVANSAMPSGEPSRLALKNGSSKSDTPVDHTLTHPASTPHTRGDHTPPNMPAPVHHAFHIIHRSSVKSSRRSPQEETRESPHGHFGLGPMPAVHKRVSGLTVPASLADGPLLSPAVSPRAKSANSSPRLRLKLSLKAPWGGLGIHSPQSPRSPRRHRFGPLSPCFGGPSRVASDLD